MDENGRLATDLKLELVNLVGKKPFVKMWLNEVKCEGLCDTGSMISLINRKFLVETFPSVKMHTGVDFLGNEITYVIKFWAGEFGSIIPKSVHSDR